MHKTLTNTADKVEAGTCNWGGCNDEGKFPAPKESMQPNDRYYFCLQHVREYNKSWNFFRKMDASQIEAFEKSSLSGHRPTWKMGVGTKGHYNVEDIKRKLFEEFLGDPENVRTMAQSHNLSRLPKHIRDALEVFNLNYPVTIEEIKKKYKELAKEHHPDLNNQTDDDKIKTINNAYNVLKASGMFN